MGYVLVRVATATTEWVMSLHRSTADLQQAIEPQARLRCAPQQELQPRPPQQQPSLPMRTCVMRKEVDGVAILDQPLQYNQRTRARSAHDRVTWLLLL